MLSRVLALFFFLAFVPAAFSDQKPDSSLCATPQDVLLQAKLIKAQLEISLNTVNAIIQGPADVTKKNGRLLSSLKKLENYANRLSMKSASGCCMFETLKASKEANNEAKDPAKQHLKLLQGRLRTFIDALKPVADGFKNDHELDGLDTIIAQANDQARLIYDEIFEVMKESEWSLKIVSVQKTECPGHPEDPDPFSADQDE